MNNQEIPLNRSIIRMQRAWNDFKPEFALRMVKMKAHVGKEKEFRMESKPSLYEGFHQPAGPGIAVIAGSQRFLEERRGKEGTS